MNFWSLGSYLLRAGTTGMCHTAGFSLNIWFLNLHVVMMSVCQIFVSWDSFGSTTFLRPHIHFPRFLNVWKVLGLGLRNQRHKFKTVRSKPWDEEVWWEEPGLVGAEELTVCSEGTHVQCLKREQHPASAAVCFQINFNESFFWLKLVTESSVASNRGHWQIKYISQVILFATRI